ncbi:MAG: CHAT domain-containing tetratricopeptide repeat protein, partial [Nodosilinea sp.]
VYASLEQYDRALEYLTQSLQLAEAHNNIRDQYFALSRLSEVYWLVEDFSQAIRHSEHLVALARQHSPSVETLIGALQTQAIAYDRAGQSDRAIAIYNDILALIEGNFPPGFRTEQEEYTLANLAAVYGDQGQYDRAIDYYQRAIAIASDHGLLEQEALYLRDLGQVYTEAQRYGEAETTLKRSFQLLSTLRRAGLNETANIDRQGTLQRVSAHLQRALVAQGKHEEALEIAEASRARAFADAFSRAELRPDEPAAQSIPDLEKFKALAKAQRATLVLYTTENIDPNAESVHRYLQYYLLDVWLIDPQGNVTFAQVPISDENLDDLIVTTRQAIDIFYGDRPEAIPQFSLFNQQAQLESIGLETTRTPRPRVEIFRTVDTMSLEAAVLDNLYDHYQLSMYPGVSRAFPEGDDFALDRFFVIPHVGTATTPTLDATQATAQAQTATLVQYSIVENRHSEAWLYIWVIQPNGRTDFRSVNLDRATQLRSALHSTPSVSDSALSALVADALYNIEFEYSDSHSANLRKQLQALHSVLIEPVADLLPSDPEAQVVFIPQGSLFLVPFAALQDPSGTYLIEKHTIASSPSVQVLGLANQRATRLRATQGNTPLSDATALMVGDPVMPSIWAMTDSGDFVQAPLRPLPGAKAEVEAIAGALNITPLVGAQATEAKVKQALPSARLIHLASHGLLNYGDPATYGLLDLPGAIALAPGSGEDGLLTAAEIMGMGLQAELAVLSACDTGQGRITGDGVVGLSRAFITAGVPSVMVSLWAVQDARTNRLMQQFYQASDQNQDKAQALRQAMLSNLQEYEHPKSWAAFTLIGSSL